MRVTLIHNPGAGRPGAGDGARRLEKMLRDAGHEVRYHSAKDGGLAKVLAKKADLVAVAGGDGTVAKVTRRMVGRGVPVAILPCGTANNIARTLGQVERPFEELVRGWPDARRVKLDVGMARGPFGERRFVEGVGVGLFAGLLTRPATGAKKRRGAVERGLERLRAEAARCEPVEVVACLDGHDISGAYLMLEAVNLRYVGPNLHLAPDFVPGDGALDVVMVTEAERARLVHYLEQWQENRERLAVLPVRRGRRLELEWPGYALHIDDKLRPKEDAGPKEIAGVVEASVGEAAVQFLVPDGRREV